MSKEHTLKLAPGYFAEVMSGNKTFEIRNNDRDFHEGDRLVLREYDIYNDSYTGRALAARIGYMCDYEQRPGFVVLALLDVKQASSEEQMADALRVKSALVDCLMHLRKHKMIREDGYKIVLIDPPSEPTI